MLPGASDKEKKELEEFMNGGGYPSLWKERCPQMERPYYTWSGEIIDLDSVEQILQERTDESGYVGRYSSNGELVAAGKFFGGTLGVYGRDGKFHYDPHHEKMYYEGEFDDISDEEFEKFKKEMDALGSK